MMNDHARDEVYGSVECSNCLEWTDGEFLLMYDTTYRGECQNCRLIIEHDFDFDVDDNGDVYDSYYDR